MRRTKIICTLGPASSSPAAIDGLIAAGMNVARLNFSHGTHTEHREALQHVRARAEARGEPVAVLQDLQGPKIRVGRLPGGRVTLRPGAQVSLCCTPRPPQGTIPCTYEALAQDLAAADPSKRHPLLLDDGRIELRVDAVDVAAGRVDATVLVGGELLDHKGINLPGVVLSTPALTAKDREDLVFGLELGVDFVALSFVRSADDCRQARALLGDVPLVAKVEQPEAVQTIGEILDVAEGIMIARGDLGVELGAERVPMVQKMLIEEANRRGRLVITATEMLESMRFSVRPTRAEASDVANAILDGSDAVMLSAETATGRHPVTVVEVMGQIIEQVEASSRYRRQADRAALDLRGDAGVTHAVVHAAVVAAREIAARTIICFTETGASATLMSEHRPAAQILAVTPHERVCRQLAMQWGVTPLLLRDRAAAADETVAAVTALARSHGGVQPGEEIVVVLGSRADGTSDLMKIHRA